MALSGQSMIVRRRRGQQQRGQCEASARTCSRLQARQRTEFPRALGPVPKLPGCPILERNMNFDIKYREAAHKRFEESCRFQNAYLVKDRFPISYSHAAFRSASTQKRKIRQRSTIRARRGPGQPTTRSAQSPDQAPRLPARSPRRHRGITTRRSSYRPNYARGGREWKSYSVQGLSYRRALESPVKCSDEARVV